MSTSGLLSVIIPTYNAEAFVEEAVASVQAQTYGSIEIILIDDGSKDGTAALNARMSQPGAGRFPVRAITQPNAGPSAARNRGIAMAQGEFVGFLDADDRWLPENAATQLECMVRDPSVGLTCAGWKIITEDGTPTRRAGGPPKGPIAPEKLLFTNVVGPTSSAIVRTEALVRAGLFEPSLRYCEDLDLWLRIGFLDGITIESVGRPLVERRESPHQLTKNWRGIHSGWLIVFERIKDLVGDRIAPLEQRARALAERYAAYLAYQSGDFAASRSLIAAAWKTSPFDLMAEPRAYPISVAALATLLPASVHQTLDRSLRRIWEGRRS